MWTRDLDRQTRQALEELGAELMSSRLDRGWSQRVLQRHSGVHQSTISRLERGRAPGTRAEAIARIRHALKSAPDPW